MEADYSHVKSLKFGAKRQKPSLSKWQISSLMDLGLKAGEPSHYWLGSRFGGKHWRNARKVSWRSGRRRSGDVGGGGTVSTFLSLPCRAVLPVSTCRATKTIADCRLPIADCRVEHL